MTKKFDYVCAGILMLVVSAALRSNNVAAQVRGSPVVSVTYVPTVSPGYLVAVTPNGAATQSAWSRSGAGLKTGDST